MLKVVKIGGNVVDNAAKLQAFLADFAAMEGAKILVHGGGKIATEIARNLGIETTMVEGRRVTDEQTLQVVTMVYNGINKQIVSALQTLGCNAVGLCGADGGLIISQKRPPVSVNGQMVDYGMVGDPVAVNTEFAQLLTTGGFTLVVAPITRDPEHGLLNTNADTVAQAIAVAMAKSFGRLECEEVELVYCFEKQGVMADVDDPGSLISHIDRAKFQELKSAGTVHSGMLPKLENAFAALDAGVSKVIIGETVIEK